MIVRATGYGHDIAITAHLLEDGNEDTFFLTETDQVNLIKWFKNNKPALLRKYAGE